MNTPTLEDQLRKQLLDLYQEHAADVRREVEPNLIEQRLNMFEENWLEKINDHEIDAGRNIKPNMAAMLEARDTAIQFEEAKRVAGIRTKEGQVAYWDNRRSGEKKPTPDQIELAREQLQERYGNLRETMQQGVRDIAEGKEPDLSQLIEKQINREELLEAALGKVAEMQRQARENDRER